MNWRLGADWAGDLAEVCRSIYCIPKIPSHLRSVLSPKMVMGLTAKSTFRVSPGTSDVVSGAGVCFKMNSFLSLFVFLAET